MTNEMINPYYRLQKLYGIVEEANVSRGINECDSSVSLLQLSQSTGIPIEILRADIAVLIETTYGFFDIISDGNYVKDTYEDPDGNKHFFADLIAGKYDDANLTWTQDDDRVMLPLTAEECSALTEILHAQNQTKVRNSLPFLIKDSYHFMFKNEKDMNNDLYNLSVCIRSQKEAVISDFTGKVRKKRRIKPIKVLYDSTMNLYAVVYLTEDGLDCVRLDKLKFEKEESNFELPDNIDKRISILPNIWGFDFSCKPVNVCVRINKTHGRGNVEKSVRKDLDRRINGKLSEEGNYLIYKDIVYGKDAFFRWIFSYGSSIVLEKPQSWRKEIISILKNEMKELDG